MTLFCLCSAARRALFDQQKSTFDWNTSKNIWHLAAWWRDDTDTTDVASFKPSALSTLLSHPSVLDLGSRGHFGMINKDNVFEQVLNDCVSYTGPCLAGSRVRNDWSLGVVLILCDSAPSDLKEQATKRPGCPHRLYTYNWSDQWYTGTNPNQLRSLALSRKCVWTVVIEGVAKMSHWTWVLVEFPYEAIGGNDAPGYLCNFWNSLQVNNVTHNNTDQPAADRADRVYSEKTRLPRQSTDSVSHTCAIVNIGTATLFNWGICYLSPWSWLIHDNDLANIISRKSARR